MAVVTGTSAYQLNSKEANPTITVELPVVVVVEE
jgi:hypothetical protein